MKKHVFFTHVGYDNFRQNGKFLTEDRGVRFAPISEEEYIEKVKEYGEFTRLPTDNELSAYLAEISADE